MRVEAARELNTWVEDLTAEAREPLAAECESGVEQLHVRPFAQHVVDDGLVLVDGDGACRVDDDPWGSGRGGGNAVDCAEDELLLEM